MDVGCVNVGLEWWFQFNWRSAKEIQEKIIASACFYLG